MMALRLWWLKRRLLWQVAGLAALREEQRRQQAAIALELAARERRKLASLVKLIELERQHAERA